MGKTIATLASLATSQVPPSLYIAGDTKSAAQMADFMNKAGVGRRPIVVEEIEAEKYWKDVGAKIGASPKAYLRYMMGIGGLDYGRGGRGNANEMVNPGEKKWR